MGPKLKRTQRERFPSRIDPAAFTGRFTLITGEVNRGKTTLAGKILSAFCRTLPGPFTVVDLAPGFSSPDVRLKVDGKSVGGTLVGPPDCRILRHHPQLRAPRLEGRDDAEQEALARKNRGRIEAVFEDLLQDEIEVLFINDCTLYLQAGPVERLLGWIRRARTAVVNGYHGRLLGSGPLSRRERAAMEQLMNQCDRWIEL